VAYSFPAAKALAGRRQVTLKVTSSFLEEPHAVAGRGVEEAAVCSNAGLTGTHKDHKQKVARFREKL
jgi:hypothetical protein